MTILKVTEKGIEKIRLAHWANPRAHIALTKLGDGLYGPWAFLHDDVAQPAMGIPVGSQEILTVEIEGDGWSEYREEPDA